MQKIKLTASVNHYSADTLTPVGLYLRLRDEFPQSLLLECTDFSSRQDAYSYICLNPVAGIEVTENEIREYYPGIPLKIRPIEKTGDIAGVVDRFAGTINITNLPEEKVLPGIFGFTSYEAINMFDNVNIENRGTPSPLPLLKYDLYSVVIAVNHFNGTMSVCELDEEAGEEAGRKASEASEVSVKAGEKDGEKASEVSVKAGEEAGRKASEASIKSDEEAGEITGGKADEKTSGKADLETGEQVREKTGEKIAGSLTRRIVSLLANRNTTTFPFRIKGSEKSNLSDEKYIDMVVQGKKHCARGDVFQIVLSRRFEQEFQGDEFSAYRALRSVNPSPYLFYFDYLGYKLFGSSPEAQLQISEGTATINPIAGTISKTGDKLSDEGLAKALLADPKENSEHSMLVDLARNDLSRHSKNVKVSTYKEVHAYSHVIHLVSTVCGDLTGPENRYKVFADTFPAGTLSGAPKHRAVQLIDEIEPTRRGYYGGAIGYIGLSGSLNHAIMIRSFASYDGKLVFQAGAGIVIDSVPEKELNEVKSKLSALRQALKMAENIK